MAKKGLDEKIPDIKTPWEGYIGSRVEEFIKSRFSQIETDTENALKLKPAYFVRSVEKGADNCYHIYGFATEADYLEWQSDPDANAELLLSDVSLPDTGGGSTAASYIVNLLRDSSADIVTIDNTVKIKIRFTSQEYNPITQTSQDTTEGGTLTIQTRLNDNAQWVTKGTKNIPSLPADSTDWTEVDITDMMASGTQQVRIIVKGETTELNTRYLRFNVTKTALGLRLATQWERPITDGVMRLGYYVSGAVSKTLHVLIDGTRKIERNLGTTVYSESPYNIEVTDSDAEPIKVITHGVHTIEAWLQVNDSTVQSQHVHSQLMVVTDSSDKTIFLLINDLNSELTNWTTEKLFSFSLYNPNSSSTPLKLVLGNYDGKTTYMTMDMGLVPNNEQHEVSNVIEIDSEEESIDAYMRFFSGETEIHSVIGFTVDNHENFSPVSNPDFVLNPRSRTNDEAEPNRIINGANDTVVTSHWEGFKFTKDGWTTDADGQRCLRILSGRMLTIDYEPYIDYINTDNRSSLTIEVDFTTRNAMKTTDPLIRMCSYMSDGKPLGFELKPQEACFMTEGNRVKDDQDVMFQEGVRTHLAINIIYGINGTTNNYVRIFVNGEINREFIWNPDDTFVQYVDGVRTSQGMRFGSDNCDLDIYGIRIYRKSLSSNDVRQDYMATLPTVAEKIAFREANNICDDSNQINYAKTRDKYNTLLVKYATVVPSFSTGNIKPEGNELEIHIVGDPDHSGTLTDLTLAGQGTSSRSYWLWNLEFKFGNNTKWTDENGVDRGGKYQLDDTVPAAKKLVAKRNWASSQQSHKMGSCNLYTDLWRRCTGGSSITKTSGFEKCRVTVKQKPFFMFIQKGDEEPQFYGLYTFGPGKGDKPTFGCDLDVFPNYLMIEGCDNGMPLTNHRIPWNEDIQLDDAGEVYMYNGGKQWEIDMGNEKAVGYFQNAFNFVYQLNPHINPWVGTIETLQTANEAQADRQQLYWVTQASTGAAKFDLYRFDALTDKWVDAGVKKLGVGSYEKLNLSTQLGISPAGNVWGDINQQFINARVAKFKSDAHLYFKLDDAFFHSMFIKMIAASDNRAKNTYLYLAEHEGRIVCHFAQDDLDTIFLTDNVGRKNKPYYVEEHDRDAEGATYWNGEQNAMYDLFELAFPLELRAMMKTMLTQMANMASDGEGDKLMRCMEDYYFHVQRYFPAVAYNETARISYEAASAVWGTQYTGSTHPITQSLGSQLEGELQWVKLRLIYLSSFASYGVFTMNGDNALTFRSITTKEGMAPTYSFALTPHIWLYPAVSAGSSTMWGRGKAMPQRVKAGETYILDGVAADNDTNVQIHGIDQFTDIGEFGDKPLCGTEFTVAGERLMEFHASHQSGEFRPPKVNVTAPNLRVFDINGVNSATGSIDFADQNRLEYIDIGGTSVTRFSVVEPANITYLHLPASLTQLSMVGYTELTTEGFTIDGVAEIQSLTFSNCPHLSSRDIVVEICSGDTMALSRCVIDNVNWENFSVNYLMKLAAIDSDLKGRIQIPTTQNITFDMKRQLLEKWGNIDDPNNPLYIEYTKRIVQYVNISGQRYFDKPGTYKMGVTPNAANSNNFTAIKWAITNNSYATIDSKTGVLTVNKVGTEEQAPKAEITVTVTLADGSEVSDTVEVGFYLRSCHLGDYVYADGSFSDILDRSKTPVGVCFYINRKNPTQRLAVALQDLSTGIQWGLYPEASNGTNGFPTITLEDTPGYNCFDIPTITNITTGISTNYITEATFRDELLGDEDGFKVFDAASAPGDMGFQEVRSALGGYKEGDVISKSLLKTLQIIQHRNIILNDTAVDLPIPYATDQRTELEHLNELMNNVVADNGSQAKFRQYYYPAASLCHAYQPQIKTDEVLSPLFLAGKWALPTAGDLCRLYWYHSRGYSDIQKEGAIFARAGLDGIFSAFGGAYYWSATEYSQTGAWGVYFSNGGVYINSKCNSYRVRAVVAF